MITGPHHEGLREALYRTDARIGKVLELLERARDARFDAVRGDLRIMGWRRRHIELNANPTVEPVKAGIKGVFAEPMIYLRDMHLECVRANDRRTLRVTVLDNDFASDGERPAIEGAKVRLLDMRRRDDRRSDDVGDGHRGVRDARQFSR